MSVRIHELLTFAVKIGASDIHVGAGEIPAMRVDGEIKRLDLPALNNDDAKRLAYSVMSEKQKTQFENNLEVDFSIGLKGLARFRINVFTHTRGVGMVLRQIPSKVLTLEEIKAPKVFERISNFKKGLVLVTGPTGSGKSTTLASMIDFINKNRSEHILTVEDPVEFVHQPNKCLINQREVGAHTHSFTNALRSALREDPDVILVGELRDLETISLALTAAETGHLVFGTLHTNSAPETVDRIIDVFPHEQQQQVRTMASTSLMAVISQTLLKRADGRGRAAAHEIMLVNPAIRNLIRENKLHQIPSIMQTARGEGMQTMDDSLRNLAFGGMITRQQACIQAANPKLFDDGSKTQAFERPQGGRRGGRAR
ncbi:MAG: type IV pilus twitching motility protein PilT [Proteobacteria bacterium]|nr:type IV pilus twitching motility protein PilT [Pseudomonadota bacterium]MCP4919715.1 type IV pilus twitching motility protein PilT [Pseudomonadota bacterium]